MHDCKAIKRKLADLVFEELGPIDRSRILAELEACADCAHDYRSMTGALRISREAIELSRPGSEFWPGYRARLRTRLLESERAENDWRPSRMPTKARLGELLRAFVTASVRVPAPVAIAVLLAFAGLASVLATEHHRLGQVRIPAVSSSMEIRTVEVPVIKEKLVSQVIYVRRKPERSAQTWETGGTITKERRSTAPHSLAGFAPTDDVKLTIIKGSYHDEK